MLLGRSGYRVLVIVLGCVGELRKVYFVVISFAFSIGEGFFGGFRRVYFLLVLDKWMLFGDLDFILLYLV